MFLIVFLKQILSKLILLNKIMQKIVKKNKSPRKVLDFIDEKMIS